MRKEPNCYGPIAQAIATILHPHAEVVIHDLKTGRIAALYNALSKRKVGDESLLEEIKGMTQFPDVFPLFFKTSLEGGSIRSTTATIRNEKGDAIALLCINLDLSKWEEMRDFISGWLQGIGGEKPALLFKDDWREKINAYVSDYLKGKGINLKTLDKDEKRELIRSLYRKGAFEAKHAASYVADVLGISRATIYNYLRSK